MSEPERISTLEDIYTTEATWFLDFRYRYARFPDDAFAFADTDRKETVSTGLYYQCEQNHLTKMLFDHVKEFHETGDDFIVVLKRSDDTSKTHDEFRISRHQFEQMTRLKVLSGEEYWENRKNVILYDDPGAEIKIIKFSSPHPLLNEK